MGVRAESGGARLIASGEITSFFGAPVVLRFDDWAFAVRFSFKQDDGDVRLDVKTGDDHAELVAYNFDEGRGTAEPMPLVRRDQWGLWLHFRVFRYGSTADHTFHYSMWAMELQPADP
ncbi:MAG: hypothetical protein EP330_29265 [Deltaproteobacteria bacterium]|nr:MAG: hypothetical protein EP330_29265 [Deltaproteobacteria bacterium]